MISLKKDEFPSFKVQNHPTCKKSQKHLKLQLKIEKKIKNNFSNKVKKNISIFIGPTGSIIEALERNVEVYHICENDLFESYSEKIWENIKVNKIDKNLFQYKIKKKKTLINLGAKNEFQKFYNYKF